MTDLRPVPRWIFIALLVCGALIGLAIVVYPFMPPRWFGVYHPQTGQPLMTYRTHNAPVPFHLLWALEGFRSVPHAVRIGGFVLLALLVATPRSWWRAWRGSRAATMLAGVWHSRWFAVSLPLVAVALFYVFRVSYERNALFGDGPKLPAQVEQRRIFPAEVLTMHVFFSAYMLLKQISAQASGLLAIVLTSCIAGGAFVAGLLLFARTVARGTSEQIALFCATAGTGAAAVFFGYVETTQIELAAMALYAGAAARVLWSPPGWWRFCWLVGAFAALSLALLAHAAGVLLVPSFVVLLWMERRRPADSCWRTTLGVVHWRNLLLTAVIVVAPYLWLIVLRFFTRGKFGNIAGGGDKIMFVPWTLEPGKISKWVYYSMFSGRHWTDIGSAVLVGAPAVLLLLLVFAWLLLRRRAMLARRERALAWLLAAAGGGCALVPLIWNHDFGMWGDWNLATCYLFPLNLFAWTAVLCATSRDDAASAPRARAISALVCVQLTLAGGMLLQLR